MSSGDLNLNSIDRFQKHSPRLILEQFSHCEVPAGCGGVVLRWRDPDAGLPVVFHIGVMGKADLFVNGREIASRTVLPWGENVLAIRLTEFDGQFPFIMSAEADFASSIERRPIEDGCTSVSGRWKFCPVELEGWTQRDFDDSKWSGLTVPNNDFPKQQSWRFEGIQRDGAQPLRIPGDSATVCIRASLTISRGVQ